MKKAQITPFIIMGIMILLTIGLIFYLMTMISTSEPEIQTMTEASSVKYYVQKCVSDTAMESVFMLGLHGWHLTEPPHVFTTSQLTTSYLYYDGMEYMPTIPAVEKNLSYYMNQMLPFCNLSVFRQFNIDTSEPSSAVTIKEDSVLFHVTWPLTIRYGNTATEISEFETEAPINVLRLHNVTAEIIEQTAINPAVIDHMFLLSRVSNISYTVFNNDTVLYFVQDPEELKDEYGFASVFAVKFR
ncbi:hypothetical protein JW968_07520 [Candidatus Woesearchaeota archaeon]|nr:hypothetical protein [Candidatus Woesearchaeota archaeon]